jgi:hypothetical protein
VLAALITALSILLDQPTAPVHAKYLQAIPDLNATVAAEPLGGRNFTISTTSGASGMSDTVAQPAVQLTWTDGTQEDNYLLLRVAPRPTTSFSLPGNASSFTDSRVLPGQDYCYILVPRNRSIVLGYSGVLCAVPGVSTVGVEVPGPEIEATLALVLPE